MNKLIIAGIGAGATVIGYTIGSIFGKKVNNKVGDTVKAGANKVKETASNMGSKVKNTLKKKNESSPEDPSTEAQTA
jgi:hypothetical protein